MQPSGSNLHYVAEAIPIPVPSPNWRISDIHPDYHVGFDVSLSATNQSRLTTLTLDYAHFYSRDHASKNVPSNDMVGPFFEIGPDASAYKRAKGRATFQYDSLNLDYGVNFCFGNYFRTTFFAGIEGVRIKQHVSAIYSNTSGSISRQITTPSTFFGAGPQLGVDFSYDICSGLQLTGEGIASLLVGNLKNHTTYKSTSPALALLGITPPNTQTTQVRDQTQVVPAFQCRLGLDYAFCFNCCKVDIDVGYEVRCYLNAIQSVDMGSEVVTPPVVPDTVGVFARTFQRNVSNFALAGPYVRLNVAF